MRVVFDTNTVVSALFWHGPPHQAMQAIRAGRAVLLSSEALIAELKDALSKEKFIARFTALGFTVQEVVALHRDLVKIIETEPLAEPASRDEDDDEVLACAISGKADAIVSGDNDLLVLKKFQSIPIWTAVAFLGALDKPSPA